MNEEYGQMPQPQKQERKQKDPNTVLLTVIGVATLLVALVGATFAFFSATVSNQSAQSITVTTGTAPAALEYKTVTQTALTNAIPDDETTGQFTVENKDSKYVYKYTLTLIIDSNGFAAKAGTKTNQLQYQITSATSNKTGSEAHTPTLQNYSTVTDMTKVTNGGGKVVVTDQIIGPGEKHTYNSKLKFVDDGTDQTVFAGGVSFAAHIEASDAQVVS